jgi:hypothetical protein
MIFQKYFFTHAVLVWQSFLCSAVTSLFICFLFLVSLKNPLMIKKVPKKHMFCMMLSFDPKGHAVLEWPS